MNYLANAISAQMLGELLKAEGGCSLDITSITPCEIPGDAVSYIGHGDTANVLSGILGREVPFNRAFISLKRGDTVYVCQLEGGRLPEGTTVLPEGFSFSFQKWELR